MRLRTALVPVLLGIVSIAGETATSAEQRRGAPVRIPVYFEPAARPAHGEMTYALRASDVAGEMRSDGVALESADGARGVLRFIGGRGVVPAAELPLPGRVHYLIGAESSWRRDVPTFARVRYANVYDGVDAVFYGDGSTLEYDLIVAPGADPRVVRVRLDGGGAARVNGDGSLSWRIGGHELRQGRPLVHQDSVHGAVRIEASYRIDANGDVGVDLGAYDRTRPLVIDPTLSFSTYVAGYVQDMTVDGDGNVYLTGVAPAGYAATPGAYQTTRKPSFVTKLDPTGRVVYATYLGGSRVENATAIAVDAAGSAYVTGYTTSPDFPTTASAAIRSCPAIQFGDCEAHGFVTRFNATGSALVYSTYIGPLGTSPYWGSGYPTDIGLDASGRATVVGRAAASFPTTAGALSSCPAGDDIQGFLLTLNASGSAVDYATCIGGSAYEIAESVVVTPGGMRVVTGDTASEDFPVVRPAQPAFGGYVDLFVVGFAPNNAVLFSTFYGGDFEESGLGAAIVDDESIWIAGRTGSTELPGDERRIGPLGSFDTLLVHLSATGDRFLSVTRLGGRRADRAVAISAGPDGRIHFAGDSQSPDLPVTEDAYQRTLGSSSYTDLFYGTLRESDGALTHLTLFGGAGRENFVALAVGPGGQAYLAGNASSTIPLRNASRTSGTDFVVRFDPDVVGTGLQKDIVLHAYRATPFGAWRIENDASAAGGRKARHANAGAATIGAPLAAPANYIELTVSAQANVAYRLWLRGRADGDHYSNDSVHLQFSDTIDPGGQPIWRIGTSSATVVQIERCVGCGLHGWGWNDNGSSSMPEDRLGALVRFATDGAHTIRIQTREDGLAIDQIVLSSERFKDTPPGAARDDGTVLAEGGTSGGTCSAGEIVLHAADATPAGAWQRIADATAASGVRLTHPDLKVARASAPLAAPTNYFELTFTASANVDHRLWIRGSAAANHWSNDSAWVQFSDSVSASGSETWRIGTTSAATYVLEDCTNCPISGWGWNDNEYGGTSLGIPVRFAASGTHRIRIQTREDGLSIDQIVLSAATYFSSAPGPMRNDATILASCTAVTSATTSQGR